jgi:hypothetical protein
MLGRSDTEHDEVTHRRAHIRRTPTHNVQNPTVVDIGLSQRQIESIGKSTAMHSLKVTYKLMWKQRTEAMNAQGRTLTGYLRRAGMVHGVAPVQPITSLGTVADAVNKLRMEAVEAEEEGRVATPQATRRYSPGMPIGTVLWEEPHGAMGIGMQDKFRRGGPRGGADTRVKAAVGIGM